jgi:steroid delta-isomerase-like uncharacterized protein
MSMEENKALFRRFIEEIINQGNLAIVDELFGSDYIYHAPGSPEFRGPEGVNQFVMMYRSAFPDLHLTVEDLIAEGDKVVTRWTMRGTHRGELMGIPATGKQVSVPGIVISRFANGKIVEEWENFDTLGLMQQLGLVPTPGQAGA